MPTQLKLKPLCMVVLAALSGATWQVHAQTQSSSADNTVAATPPAVVVTGSRIPRASLEGPSSVTILTGEEITRQGYKNVFDALSNQVQNSGLRKVKTLAILLRHRPTPSACVAWAPTIP